ncbi:MAG: DUF2225 domain-containing protein [Alkalispirochaetaceae bacterium]
MASLTFFTKNKIQCPVCDEGFHREEMRTGRGRMIAGDLTRELRRNYEASKHHGEVYPLIYPVTVCPSCFYAAYPPDFDSPPEKGLEALREDQAKRKGGVEKLFDYLNFTEPRRLQEGVASYILAIFSYDHFSKQVSPKFKQGLSALRGAWLSGDLHRKAPSENYDYLQSILYRKARFFYSVAVEWEQTGREPLSGAGMLGPDLDKNYGYDGVLYLSGLLEYKYGPKKDAQRRAEALDRAKRTIARIFGMGKASKDKPAAILDNAREVYEEISRELGDGNSDPEADES